MLQLDGSPRKSVLPSQDTEQYSQYKSKYATIEKIRTISPYPILVRPITNLPRRKAHDNSYREYEYPYIFKIHRKVHFEFSFPDALSYFTFILKNMFEITRTTAIMLTMTASMFSSPAAFA
jgi:hypothetical protein